MKIKTKHGDFDSDNLKVFDLSKETLTFIEEHAEAAELFFQEEIDVDEIPKEIDDDIRFSIAEKKYPTPVKALALSNLLSIGLADIEVTPDTNTDSSNDHLLKVGTDSWIVLTDEEADLEVYEDERYAIEHDGEDNFTSGYFTKDQLKFIYDNFIDYDYDEDEEGVGVVHIDNVDEATEYSIRELKKNGKTRDWWISRGTKEEFVKITYKGEKYEFYLYNKGKI